MKFEKIRIKNFKGIENIEIDLNRNPQANIYTLIGLNESGKTTILEAINQFAQKDESINNLELPGAIIDDYNNIIPINTRDNFNGEVIIEVDISLDEDDLNEIELYIKKNTQFKSIERKKKLTYFKYFKFENSRFIKLESKWSGISGKKNNGKKFQKLTEDDNFKASVFCKSLIPSILYFPNFLFDFPSKIYLEDNQEGNKKQIFYKEIIQDILYTLENNTNIEKHIIERFKNKEDKNDKRNLETLLKKMNRKVTDVVFSSWNQIFKRDIKETSVLIDCYEDEGGVYLEFQIESSDGIYQINERSMGFRWFFTFLLLTQFRPFRKDKPKNIMFLFDEPASNLHSLAQKQLLKSFENLLENCKIIYTTHSHHLINPNWLESTYVVKNEGLDLENIEDFNIKATNISVTPYRDFATLHPHNTAYFQPVLDVLDYVPSNLEMIPNCIFLEGKNDFYTLTYFNEILFKNRYDLNLSPSTGSGNIDTLISLYIGWAKPFIILLDSDKSGKNEKERYIENFGIYLEDRVFLLSDINNEWSNFTLEDLFSKNDLLNFQKSKFIESQKFIKKQFNRVIQENLMNKTFFEFENKTINNIEHVLKFLESKINNLKIKLNN
ncbi:AAA family ATPase [Flavobacterium filum]|uniref:AAA family ATPase n=1 Tax=Flavobacterium TaxID=237 RepID=UPI000403AFF7|nr:AAA family ATPase [Flavobacterium filum]